MGFRYRKSINLGGGFRINLSKSGVGYSWGGKGFRVTKTATGRTRTTTSIPGTGLSWVEESGEKKHGTNIPQPQIQTNDSIHAYSIENAKIEELAPAQLQDFLDAVKHYMKISSLLTWSSIILFIVGVYSPPLMLLFAVALICKLVFKIKGRVNVQYEYDEYGEKKISLIQSLMEILQSNKAMWQVNDVFHNTRTKVHAGASQSISRSAINIQTKKPYFLNTNVTCYFVKLKKEKLYILPDKMIVVSKNKVGAIDLSDLDMSVADKQFIENVAPKDAQILSFTWQYVNKNGTPDKRFNNNRQLPVCRYGTISFKTQQGFNTLIYCSNVNKAAEFFQVLNTYLEQKRLLEGGVI